MIDRCHDLVLHILSVFCDSTLTPEAYIQNPNLVEDFYDLCGRSLQNIPEVLFRTGDMVLHITEAALPGIQLQHREANNSVMRFLETLATYGQEVQLEEGELAVNVASYRADVWNVLSVCGQELVSQLVGDMRGMLDRLEDLQEDYQRVDYMTPMCQ